MSLTVQPHPKQETAKQKELMATPAHCYWIHENPSDNMATDGYVGVSVSPDTRLAEHKATGKVSAYAILHIVFSGTYRECLEVEKVERPLPNMGLNCHSGGGFPISLGSVRSESSKLAQSKRMKEMHANLTPKRKREIAKKRRITFQNRTPEAKEASRKNRSAAMKRIRAEYSPEKEAASTRRILANRRELTKGEKLLRNARISAAMLRLTPEQRRVKEEKRIATLAKYSPEERAASYRLGIETRTRNRAASKGGVPARA